MEDLTVEQMHQMELTNGQYIWIEKNLGRLWVDTIIKQPNERQWALWNELRTSKLGKVWDENLAREKK